MIMANDNNIQPVADDSQIVLYQPDDSIRLEVKLDQDTVWLTQAQMTELFRTTRNNITMHIRNIFKEKELDEKSVCKESLHDISQYSLIIPMRLAITSQTKSSTEQ